jgi:hypothetical protein
MSLFGAALFSISYKGFKGNRQQAEAEFDLEDRRAHVKTAAFQY